MGIIGTPVVDLASRALFLNAMTTPDGGTTKKHYIFSLNVDTGAINPGWPVDVEATATYNGTTFTPAVQQQRSALAIVNNILYVAYGSIGDCSLYHGWLVGVPINNPASVTAWATSAIGGGIWGLAASPVTAPIRSLPPVTLSTTGGNWGGGEAVIRFQPGPIFSGNPAITGRPRIGSLSTLAYRILAAPAHCLWTCRVRRPPSLSSQLGKDGNSHIYLIEITSAASAWRRSRHQLNLQRNLIMQAAAAYRTNQGTYVAFRAGRARTRSFPHYCN